METPFVPDKKTPPQKLYMPSNLDCKEEERFEVKNIYFIQNIMIFVLFTIGSKSLQDKGCPLIPPSTSETRLRFLLRGNACHQLEQQRQDTFSTRLSFHLQRAKCKFPRINKLKLIINIIIFRGTG